MKNKIYYFTGTGNTLDAAKKIANLLGETDLVRITAPPMDELVPCTYARIGIFTPTYMGTIPSIVKEFIQHLVIQPNTYLFSVVTCGGMEVSTHHAIKKAFAKRNIPLNAAFTLDYPANNQIRYAPVSIYQARKLITKNDPKINEISKTIKAQETTPIPLNPVMEIMARGFRGIESTKKSKQQFQVDATCVGCGLCEKVCSVSNISLLHNKPHWYDHCEKCTACMQLCPQASIQFNVQTRSWGRYKNPFITTNELMITRS